MVESRRPIHWVATGQQEGHVRNPNADRVDRRPVPSPRILKKRPLIFPLPIPVETPPPKLTVAPRISLFFFVIVVVAVIA